MNNIAIDILRSHKRRIQEVSVYPSSEEDSGISLYDCIPDPEAHDFVYEILLREALKVLPKDRKWSGTEEEKEKRHPAIYIKDVGNVHFCHYWVYYFYILGWNSSEIADIFSVSSTRIHQIVLQCKQYMKESFGVSDTVKKQEVHIIEAVVEDSEESDFDLESYAAEAKSAVRKVKYVEEEIV